MDSYASPNSSINKCTVMDIGNAILEVKCNLSNRSACNLSNHKTCLYRLII